MKVGILPLGVQKCTRSCSGYRPPPARAIVQRQAARGRPPRMHAKAYSLIPTPTPCRNSCKLPETHRGKHLTFEIGHEVARDCRRSSRALQ